MDVKPEKMKANLQWQEADQLLPEDGELGGKGRREGWQKTRKSGEWQMFSYPDGGHASTDVYTCQSGSNCTA